MNIAVLGGGVIGITTAWYLRSKGLEVTVFERQPGPALETSFANGGQISVSHAEPWANPGTPLKALRWLAREDAPLLFRLRADRALLSWSARFLRECLRRFQLPGVTVHEARAESLHDAKGFRQVISRAYAELADFVASTRQILAADGHWLALKGKRPDAEIARLPGDVEVIAIHRLAVPGADGERHLLDLRLRHAAD